MRLLLSLFLALLLNACATPQLRGTGDLGLIIERSTGHVTLVNTTSRQPYARISGLGDLSHASAVYSRDGRYAYISAPKRVVYIFFTFFTSSNDISFFFLSF